MEDKKRAIFFAMLVILFASNSYLRLIRCQLMPIVGDDQIKTYVVFVEEPVGGANLLNDEELASFHKSFLPNNSLGSGEERMIYSYRHAISGFAALLTADEVLAMETKPGFLFTRLPEEIRTQTTYTPQFMGLSEGGGLWWSSQSGEGIIIGVIDTGITPTHPSFQSFNAVPAPPVNWFGNCSFGPNVCNNKLIGAMAFQGGKNPSPVDDNGHGTHCASIAAGSPVYDAGVLNQARGMAVGTAPRAHISVYKVFFQNSNTDDNLLAGIDQAIRDGVNVLSMSLGSGPRHLYQSGIAVSSFYAITQGIVPCVAAGNDGPTASVISNDAPWIFTIGASSTDRRIKVTVKLGNGMEIDGESAYQPDTHNAIDLELAFPGASDRDSDLSCSSLNQTDVKGKIVLCVVGGISNVKKGRIVKAAGGEGVIIMNSKRRGFTTSSEPHVLPAAHISNVDARKIVAYMQTTRNPTASIVFKGTQFGASPAPSIAYFSSRGPSQYNGGFIKPDIVAPGVNILAAWPFEVGPNPTGNTTSTFNFESGTSMATPHVAGIAADLKKNHPDWSPAMIKSAIMTTASTKDLDGNPIASSYFAMGAGHVNPEGANDPGLVYDIQPMDYIPYLCGMYSTRFVKAIVRQQWVDCNTIQSITAAEVNYPSISMRMPVLAGSAFAINRTLTNVGPAKVYNLTIQLPDGVDIRADTNSLTFLALNEQQSFRLQFTSNGHAQSGQVSEGYLSWASASHVVRSPISVTYY
ncbi:Peptidase S8 subtilisin-related protein [Dioscorea alata]|uniref:Peptidase S8 subtilisin-related protein n=1 Tax=Dioscorea alata TaxID=55571 RepID=A0ACB7UPV4_DIOAL|nr:Peptidase S8 subtilisin-related protein [Dioscorea alata]